MRFQGLWHKPSPKAKSLTAVVNGHCRPTLTRLLGTQRRDSNSRAPLPLLNLLINLQGVRGPAQAFMNKVEASMHGQCRRWVVQAVLSQHPSCAAAANRPKARLAKSCDQALTTNVTMPSSNACMRFKQPCVPINHAFLWVTYPKRFCAELGHIVVVGITLLHKL